MAPATRPSACSTACRGSSTNVPWMVSQRARSSFASSDEKSGAACSRESRRCSRGTATPSPAALTGGPRQALFSEARDPGPANRDRPSTASSRGSRHRSRLVKGCNGRLFPCSEIHCSRQYLHLASAALGASSGVKCQREAVYDATLIAAFPARRPVPRTGSGNGDHGLAQVLCAGLSLRLADRDVVAVR